MHKEHTREVLHELDVVRFKLQDVKNTVSSVIRNFEVNDADELTVELKQILNSVAEHIELVKDLYNEVNNA